MGRRFCTVASGGEFAFFGWLHGARIIHAVDVSRKAIELARLKKAAFTALPWDRFVRFFLGDLPKTRLLFLELGLAWGTGWEERRSIYRELRPFTAEEDRSFWDRLFLADESFGPPSPFLSLFRPTDYLGLEALPFLVDPTEYARWQRAAASAQISWVKGPIENHVSGGDLLWDAIYVANLPEYLVMDAHLSGTEPRARLLSFLWKAVRNLRPGGWCFSYFFESPGGASWDRTWRDLRLGGRGLLDYEVSPFSVPFHLRRGLRFRHTLVAARRRK